MNKEEKLKKITELEDKLKLIELEKKVVEGEKTILTVRPWYKKWYGIIFILCTWPYWAIWYIWKKTDFQNEIKYVLTGIVVLVFILGMAGGGDKSENKDTPTVNQTSEAKQEEVKKEETILPTFTLLTNVDDIKNSDKVDHTLEFRFDVYDKVTVGEKKNETEIKAENGIFKYTVKLDEANKDYKFSIKGYNKERRSDNFVTVSRKPNQRELAILNETVSQKNAIKSAKSYVAYSGFSRDGLIHQLEFEKFSHEDAVYGADNSGADWNVQAARSAKSYLEYSSFSRDGLIHQLEFEKFTREQAEYGASAVGL